MKNKLILILTIFVFSIAQENIKTYKNDLNIQNIFNSSVKIIKNKKYYTMLNIEYNKSKVNNCNIYENILHCDNNNTIILIKQNNTIYPIKMLKNNNNVIIIKKYKKQMIKTKKKITNKPQKQFAKTKQNKIIENILKSF